MSRRAEIMATKKRYVGGLDVLKKTEDSVKGMQAELESMVPHQKQAQRETQELMKTIEKDQKSASENKLLVEKEEKIVLVQEKEAKELSDDCEAQLNEAMPALLRAQEMVAKLEKKMLDEMKQMRHPPSGVKLVMEAICVMKGVKPTAIRSGTGKTELDYWESSKKVLADPKFVSWIFGFNADAELNDDIVAAMRPYLTNPDFTPEVVKNHSAAAANICGWIHAIVDYYEKMKIVRPKKKALEEARATLEDVKKRLEEKRATLAAIEAGLKELMEKYSAAVVKRDRLAEQVATCERKLNLAKAVISGLGGEKTRWSATANEQDARMKTLTGDMVLSSAALSYFGAFTISYRSSLSDFIKDEIAKYKYLPISADASLINCLGVPTTIRQWQIYSLPTDSYSTENAIIGTTGLQWPLFIDPQGQANKWIKQMEKKRNLKILRPDANLMRSLEQAVRYGWCVLIEGVTESIDSALYPLLAKAVFKSRGQLLIRLGDNDVEYDPAFQLYLTTKHPNPSYPPEISTKCCLVNFTLTPAGLEDQLLGMVIQSEMPAMEEQRNKLIMENAEAQEQKQAAEDGILAMLTDPNQTDLLADATLVDKLKDSKELAASLDIKMQENQKMGQKIAESRTVYMSIAQRGSALFFCIASLRNIDPMYQYSLNWFVGLFTTTLSDEPQNPDQMAKIQLIMSHLLEVVYTNVCRSLFQSHKLLFGFLLAITVEGLKGKVDQNERKFLANGPSSLSSRIANPDPSWITEQMWRDISGMTELKTFEDIETHFTKRTSQWKKWIHTSMDTDQSQGDNQFQIPPLPKPYAERASPLGRLCLIRVLRPDWLPFAITDYVVSTIGERYVRPPPFDLASAFKDSNNLTPLVFVLSPGADPSILLKDFSVAMKKKDKLVTLSLGQKQDKPAQELLRVGKERGLWVFLQNCHLYPSWMPAMEELLESINPVTTHPEFRVWLTSMPTPTFPVAVLQNAVKMTNEPPIGVRANVERAFLRYSDEFVSETCNGAPIHWQRLLYNLTYFHALILERRQFGPLGFNIPYEFNESDLLICEQQLQMFMEQTIAKHKALLALTAGAEGNTDDSNAKEEETGKGKKAAAGRNQRPGSSSSKSTVTMTKEKKRGGSKQTIALAEQNKSNAVAAVSSEVIAQINELIPWKALIYITGHVNYGGRVTDDWDRRTLLSLLDEMYTPAALSDPEYNLFGKPPPPLNNTPFTRDDFLKYIDDNLSSRDEPELFGLHANAGLTLLRRQGNEMVGWLVDLQPGMSGASEEGQSKVVGLAKDILAQLPPNNFDIPAIRKKYPTRHDECMNTVLVQDLVRYNKLLTMIRSTLTETINALLGLVVLSATCERIASQLTAGQVPDAWAPVSYPSLKGIGAWVSDLKLRLGFMSDWVRDGPPVVFPLPYFFFPQAFLTGTLQNYARSRHIPIDLIAFRHLIIENPDEEEEEEEAKAETDGATDEDLDKDIDEDEDEDESRRKRKQKKSKSAFIKQPPPDGEGCFVSGLFMDGARWNRHTHTVGESIAGELIVSMPIIWLRPEEKSVIKILNASDDEMPGDGSDKGKTEEEHEKEREMREKDRQRMTDLVAAGKLPSGLVISSPANRYDCPVYKISTRAGTLSTTGHSTNYVLTITLPSDMPPKHWVRRGVALLCQPD